MISVLIVEDDPMVREINSKYLKTIEGFKLVGAVGSINDAKEIIKERCINLVLLDVYLPKDNGLEFLKWLRKEDIKCDVILITADQSIDSVKEAFMYGAVDYLIKPFQFPRFKEALEKFRDLKVNLQNCDKVEQEMIDRLIIKGKSERFSVDKNEQELVKGLNNQTYERVWNELKNFGSRSFTAEEISESMGMARVTVRRYLEYMLSEGKLTIDIEYGKIGRPQHKYRVL